MSTVMGLLPTLAGVVVVAIVVTLIYTLARHRMHPLQVLVRGVSAASMLGIVSLVGVLSGWPWWSMWLLALGLVTGIGLACRRLLAEAPPEHSAEARTRYLAPPSRTSLILEGAVYLAVLVFALAAG